MPEQLSLEHAYLPSEPRDTQVLAAEAILPRTGTQRRRVLDAIAASDGLTDEELQDRLGMNPSSERPRRLELLEAELIRDSGRRRHTRSGLLATVWEENAKEHTNA